MNTKSVKRQMKDADKLNTNYIAGQEKSIPQKGDKWVIYRVF